MTMCPISREQMIHPFVAPDKHSYERDIISEWSVKKRRSPLTREIMEMFMLTQDHTMDRVIKSMKDCNITESVIQTLGTSEDKTSNTSGTTSSIHPPSELTESIVDASGNTLQHISKKRKKIQKLIRLKKNRKAKERALKVLKNHISFLKEMKFYDEINLKAEIPTLPSYSIMHSLDEGFSIVMYSGSHRVNLRAGFCLHKNCGIRIILPKWMAIIWHESLYHSGGKSRTRQWVITLEVLRFFGYVWPKVVGNTRN